MKDIEKVEFHTKKWHEEQRKKPPINAEWYKKQWTDTEGNFDRYKYQSYKAHNRLLSALCRKKYGIILADNFIYIKKVIGGIMVDGTRARVKTIVVNFSKIKTKMLQDQLNYIDNLINNH